MNWFLVSASYTSLSYRLVHIAKDRRCCMTIWPGKRQFRHWLALYPLPVPPGAGLRLPGKSGSQHGHSGRRLELQVSGEQSSQILPATRAWRMSGNKQVSGKGQISTRFMTIV